jgi:ATP-binding cassette subfamily B protein
MARDMSFYDEYPTGKIVSRVTSDTQDFANVVTLTLNLISQVLLVAIIFSCSSGSTCAWPRLQALVAPVVVIIALGFRRLARVTTTAGAPRPGRTSTPRCRKRSPASAVAKAFRQEETIYAEFTGVNRQSYRINLRQGFVFSGIFPVLNAVAGIGTALIVYFGGMSVLGGQVSPGAWFLFVESISLFWFPLTGIASFWSQFQLGMSASERVFALIDAEARVTQVDSQPIDRPWPGASSSATSPSITPSRSRCWPTSASRFLPGRPWRWSATPAPASRAWASWWRASTSSRAASC